MSSLDIGEYEPKGPAAYSLMRMLILLRVDSAKRLMRRATRSHDVRRYLLRMTGYS